MTHPSSQPVGNCIGKDASIIASLEPGNGPRSFPAISYRCALSSYSVFHGLNQRKTMECVSQTAGISLACSLCVSRTAVFSFSNCKAPCLFKWCARKCLSCVARHDKEAQKCTGLFSYQRPAGHP